MEKEKVFMKEGISSSTIRYGGMSSGMYPNNEELNCGSFFSPNWENSMDQNDPFESALSSMVSSPTASNANGNGENIVLRELIGRLGSICSNSGEINNNNNSANTSLYSTPLNSPPKLNLSMMHHLAPFSTDPAFAERAARFSCFAEMAPKLNQPQPININNNNNNSNNNCGSHTMEDADKKKFSWPEDSKENSSSVSQQIPIDPNSKKRKSIPKGKAKGNGKEPPTAAKDANIASENSESSGKRSKSEDGSANEKDNKGDPKQQTKEPPKDYIHVRARRGQATDAHSLAERVRREKISERMKVLQDLVPGCNKVTGKAVMLDEIINYVQSLQRQVEFLSMKLATVNPRMDFNTEALMSNSKDMMYQPRGSLHHNIYPSDIYPFQSQPNAIPNGTEANNFSSALGRNQSINLPPVDNFSHDTASQVSTFWEDDLHSVVHMGFGQNQTQDFQGILSTTQMKVEL